VNFSALLLGQRYCRLHFLQRQGDSEYSKIAKKSLARSLVLADSMGEVLIKKG
jgi:hypothetical protein